MNTDATRAHIDAETLAAWADHGLSADAAAAVELHLSQCDRCQEVLAAFVRSAPTAGAAVIPFWARRPVQWTAAGLAAAAAVLLVVWTGRPPDVSLPESTVASAPGTQPPPPIPVPPTPPVQSVPPAASPAPAERRRERPTQGQAAASPALPAPVPPAQTLAKPSLPSTTAVPLAAPPPPPAAAMPPPVTVSAAAPVATDAFFAVVPIIEIVAPEPSPPAMRAVAGGAGRGGAVRSELLRSSIPARWRIVGGTELQRSVDAGVTWHVLPIEPALTTPLLAGAAVSQSVCWLVGSGGVVLVTTDGSTFRRASLSDPVRLTGVVAQDGLRATVTAADGRTFSTIDGGVTWK